MIPRRVIVPHSTGVHSIFHSELENIILIPRRGKSANAAGLHSSQNQTLMGPNTVTIIQFHSSDPGDIRDNDDMYVRVIY